MIIKYLMAAYAIFNLASCGGNASANNDENGRSNTEPSSFTGVIVVKSVDNFGNESFVSNQISVENMIADDVITWSEPTRKQFANECIDTEAQPLNYQINFDNGLGSSKFIASPELSNIGLLKCGNATSHIDKLCGVSITTCQYSLYTSPFD